MRLKRNTYSFAKFIPLNILCSFSVPLYYWDLKNRASQRTTPLAEGSWHSPIRFHKVDATAFPDLPASAQSPSWRNKNRACHKGNVYGSTWWAELDIVTCWQKCGSPHFWYELDVRDQVPDGTLESPFQLQLHEAPGVARWAHLLCYSSFLFCYQLELPTLTDRIFLMCRMSTRKRYWSDTMLWHMLRWCQFRLMPNSPRWPNARGG